MDRLDPPIRARSKASVSPGFSSTYWLQALLVIALAARQPRCGAEQVARRGLWVVRERM